MNEFRSTLHGFYKKKLVQN